MFKKYWNKMVTNVVTPSVDMDILPIEVQNRYNELLGMSKETHPKLFNEKYNQLIYDVEHMHRAQRANPTLRERAENTQRFLDMISIRLK